MSVARLLVKTVWVLGRGFSQGVASVTLVGECGRSRERWGAEGEHSTDSLIVGR